MIYNFDKKMENLSKREFFYILIIVFLLPAFIFYFKIKDSMNLIQNKTKNIQEINSKINNLNSSINVKNIIILNLKKEILDINQKNKNIKIIEKKVNSIQKYLSYFNLNKNEWISIFRKNYYIIKNNSFEILNAKVFLNKNNKFILLKDKKGNLSKNNKINENYILEKIKNINLLLNNKKNLLNIKYFFYYKIKGNPATFNNLINIIKNIELNYNKLMKIYYFKNNNTNTFEILIAYFEVKRIR